LSLARGGGPLENPEIRRCVFETQDEGKRIARLSAEVLLKMCVSDSIITLYHSRMVGANGFNEKAFKIKIGFLPPSDIQISKG